MNTIGNPGADDAGDDMGNIDGRSGQERIIQILRPIPIHIVKGLDADKARAALGSGGRGNGGRAGRRAGLGSGGCRCLGGRG